MKKEDIIKIISDTLRSMGIDSFEIETSEQNDVPKFLIKTEHPGLLIGSGGENLSALTHLVKKIVSSKNPDAIKFFIDVNGYQEQNILHIKNKALVIADRARSFKTSIEMDPGTSYERMVVHALFTDVPDIKTESIGVGPNRRVVIKFVNKEEKDKNI